MEIYTKVFYGENTCYPCQDVENTLLIHWAVICGYADSLKKYLRAGYNVNSRNEVFETPLHLAVMLENLELIKLLINHGADINAQTYHKNTPLHLACAKGNLQIVKELLNSGANVKAINNELELREHTPFHCVIFGCEFMYELLVGYQIFMQCTMKHSFNKILDAKTTSIERENRLEILYALETKGIRINHLHLYDIPMLHICAKMNLVSLSRRLIYRGARIDLFDRHKKTVMFYALTKGFRELVELYLKHGENVNQENLILENRYFCCENCSPNNCKYSSIYKYTPLDIAIYYQQKDVASILINAGADLSAISDTLYHCISTNRMNPSLFHLLIDSGIMRESCAPNVPLTVFKNEHYSVNNDMYASLIDRFININDIFFPISNMYLKKWAIKLIVKMESADQFKMDPDLENRIKKTESFLTLYYSKCKKEVDILKKTNICGYVKLYDLLVQPYRMLVVYSRNVELIRMLGYGICDKFRVYGGIIESRMRFAQERKELLDRCIERFSDVCPIILPRFVQLQIFSYLNLSNLYSLSWT